jgi:hypothetical protein
MVFVFAKHFFKKENKTWHYEENRAFASVQTAGDVSGPTGPLTPLNPVPEALITASFWFFQKTIQQLSFLRRHTDAILVLASTHQPTR